MEDEKDSHGEKSNPNSSDNTQLQRGKMSIANSRQEEHSQQQARTDQGRPAAASKPQRSSFRKGRSQDTARDVTRLRE